jgi:hypothetical protein
LREVIGRVSSSLMLAVVVPAVLLWAVIALANVTAAVLTCLTWMMMVMVWRFATRRPVSGLLLLSLAILTVKTAFTLITGNTFVYFVQPVFADLAVGAIFLGSLGTRRPMIARLAPDFYPMSDSVAARPAIQAHFRRLTLLWGVVVLAKGGITLWLLESLSDADFVLVKGGAIITLTLTAAVVTIAWSYLVVRQQDVVASHTGMTGSSAAALSVPKSQT